jgi:hypothetical protein
MNRIAWIYRAALELGLGTVLLVVGTVCRYPHSHFGVWLGLKCGAAFGWVSAPHAARLYIAAMPDAALLVGTLLIASAAFVCWELARSEHREKPVLLA